jgi:hypothetical protein
MSTVTVKRHTRRRTGKTARLSTALGYGTDMKVEPYVRKRPYHVRKNPYRTITPNDVRRPLFQAFGQKWQVSGFMGEIQPRDVGKRVYLVDDILQVENDEQFSRRTGWIFQPVPLGTKVRREIGEF